MFPIQLIRSPSGSWHLVHEPRPAMSPEAWEARLAKKRATWAVEWDETILERQSAPQIHCCTHTSPLLNRGQWYEIRDMKSLEALMDGLYIPKPGKHGQGRLVGTINGRMPRIDNIGFCTPCLAMLVKCFLKEKGILMKIDVTKPIIVCSDGTVRQAEGKTLTAAKAAAKEIVQQQDVTSAVIFKPHIKLERRLPPVTETKLG